MPGWIKIQSYKHDGALHRCWESNFLISETDDFYITASTRTRVVETDGRRWFSKEPAVSFFHKRDWYNVIAMIKDEGIIFYVNLASPTLMSEGMLRYIDYDLDFKLFPDGTIVTLDEREHEHHKQKYNYPSDLLQVIELAKQQVLAHLERRDYPFDPTLVTTLYQRFLKQSAKSASRGV